MMCIVLLHLSVKHSTNSVCVAKLFRGVGTFVEKRGTIVFTTKSSPTDVSNSTCFCNVQVNDIITTSI